MNEVLETPVDPIITSVEGSVEIVQTDREIGPEVLEQEAGAEVRPA